MYVPASQLTQKTPRCLSLSNSYSLLSWIVRIRSCLLTAEIRGGRWKSAPVKVSRARASCASPPGSLSCNRMTQTYSFPAPCCDFTSLVARSMQTIRQPVTLGSSVPLCPVFSTLQKISIHAFYPPCNNSPQNPLNPRDDFMTGWIRGLIKVNDTRTDVGFEITLQRSAAIRNGCEMPGAYEYCRLISMHSFSSCIRWGCCAHAYHSFSTVTARCWYRLLE
jgi:hypothetical protein